MTPPHGYAAIVAAFGDPMPYVEAKAAWEAEALRIAALSRPLLYAYDPRGVVQITRIRGHMKVAEHLAELLNDCIADGVPRTRMKYGGCYQWRAKRSGGTLSTHTWGIAVDLEPAENPMGKPWADDGVMLHPLIIARFEAAGWAWGGRWARPDAMHFQFATGY